MEQRLLSVKQTSDYLGIGLTKCRELIHKMEFGIRIGNRWYADKEVLDEWIKTNRNDNNY